MAIGDQERLAVLISANTAQYNRGMAQMESRTRQTMGRSTAAVRSLDAQMKSAAATARGFMAMFGVTLGFAGISRLLSDLDELGKQAKRTGVDVESLQAIIFGARLSGVQASSMERGLQRLNEEIGKMAAGEAKKLTELFQDNNIAIRDANGNLRSTKELFHEIANLVAGASSHQEAARIAQLAMGRSGRELVPHLQQGAEALREQEQAAKDTGLVIREELIKKAEEFNDDWARQITQWKVSFINAIGEIGTELAKFRAFLLDRPGINATEKLVGDAIRRMGGSTDGADEPSEQSNVGRKGDRLPISIKPTKVRDPEAERAAKAIERQREAVVRLISDLEHEQRLLGMSEAQRQVENTLRQAGAAATDEQRVKIEGLVRSIHAAEQAAQDAEAQMQFFGFAAMNALDGLINRGDKAKDVLGNMVKMLAQAAMQASLLGSGPLAGLFGTKASGGLFGSFAGAFADGGHIPSGQIGLVGERGPELISGPANVTPMGGGGAGGVTIGSVHIDARGAERGVEAKIGAALEQFRQGLPSMVRDDLARGRV